MNDKYRIDRKPSSGERIVGIIASSFLVLFFGTASVITRDFLSAISWYSLVPIGFGLAAILAAVVAYRTLFGKAERPSPTTVRIVDYVFVVVGLLLIGISLFADDTSKMVYGLAIGLLGVGIGLRNLSFH